MFGDLRAGLCQCSSRPTLVIHLERIVGPLKPGIESPTADPRNSNAFVPYRGRILARAIQSEIAPRCGAALPRVRPLQKCHANVFGEGPRSARLILLGEMPGDEEDKQGHPFVGPAGRLLDDALDEAGLDRDEVYVTNAVKHFRWEPRGKRRLHKKPSARQIEACKPWLHAEILVVKPEGIVCLGATAAQTMLGRDFRITKHRGKFFTSDDVAWLMATYHPSAILRRRIRRIATKCAASSCTTCTAAAQRLNSSVGKRRPAAVHCAMSRKNLPIETFPAEELARLARLQYVSDEEAGFSRRCNGHGFCYTGAGGIRLRDPRTLQRIESLAIPPAWTDVWICRSADGHLQVTGRDDRHRKQYIYHERWREISNLAKFLRLGDWAEFLPELRRAVARDLRGNELTRHRVLAGMVALLDLTSIRIGNEEYVRQNNSYGLATLRTRHVTFGRRAGSAAVSRERWSATGASSKTSGWCGC